MSAAAAPAPPPTAPPAAPPATATTAKVVLPGTEVTAMWVGTGLISLLFFLAFHVGAGYLSYQKYGSGAWAFVDSIFPYIYYPYYAFFLAKEPGPSMGMVGGRKMAGLPSIAKALGLGKLPKNVL